MTANQLTQYTKRRLTAQPGGEVWADREMEIWGAVPTAIHELSVKVMMDPARRTLLQQIYTVALDGAGVGDLLAAAGSITAVAGEILQPGIPLGVVLDADSNRLVQIPHKDQFYSPAPTVFGYYCLADYGKILTRAINAQVNNPLDIISVNGPLTITASYAPAAVDNVPAEIQDDLVGIHVEVLLRQIGSKEQ